MDDCIQETMLRCMQVPSITAVGPIVTEKLTKLEKLKSMDRQTKVIQDPVPNLS